MAAKNRAPHYPCIGYCVIDSRGYCVACGRPPTLGMPESCASAPPKTEEPRTPGSRFWPFSVFGKRSRSGDA